MTNGGSHRSGSRRTRRATRRSRNRRSGWSRRRFGRTTGGSSTTDRGARSSQTTGGCLGNRRPEDSRTRSRRTTFRNVCHHLGVGGYRCRDSSGACGWRRRPQDTRYRGRSRRASSGCRTRRRKATRTACSSNHEPRPRKARRTHGIDATSATWTRRCTSLG